MPDHVSFDWLLPGDRAMTRDGDLFLTSEQAHVLSAVARLATLPGVGELPIDIRGRADERLCVDAAIRSLEARGILTVTSPPAIHPEVHAILRDHAFAPAVLTLIAAVPERTRRAVWSVGPTRVVECTAVTPTDYRLHAYERGELGLRIAAVAGLDACGDDWNDVPFTLARAAWDRKELVGRVIELTCSHREGSLLRTAAVVAAARDEGGGWWAIDEPDDKHVELEAMGEGALIRRLAGTVPAGLGALEPLIAEPAVR